MDLLSLVARISNRELPRTEATLQADIHHILVMAPLNLGEDDLGETKGNKGDANLFSLSKVICCDKSIPCLESLASLPAVYVYRAWGLRGAVIHIISANPQDAGRFRT